MKKIFAISTIMLSLAAIVSCDKDKLDKEDAGDNTRVPITLTKAEEDVAGSANKFAFDVYRALYEDDQMLVSPLSLSLALSMTACGADGNTASQMSATLGFAGLSADDVASYYNKMVTNLTAIDKKTTFESANSIWIDKEFSVRKDFVSTAKEYFAAEQKSVSFKDNSTLNEINKWCSDKTHGKIDKMLDSLDPRTVMTLINAIYFNGMWGIDFDEKTRKEKFRAIDGTKSNVDMMSVSHLLNIAKSDGWSMIEIPYGNGAFQMDVILPPEDMPLKDAAGKLDLDIWKQLHSGCLTHLVNLKMPEFKFEYEAEGLPSILKGLGMVDAFTPSADFSKMADTAVNGTFYIGDVKHKTYIDVNTKGTEAAAVTVVAMLATSASGGEPKAVDFTVDRPFFFIIHEQSTGSILFIGQKVN